MEEELGVREALNKLIKQNDELIAQREVKKWKLPFSARVSKAQVKKGYATILVVKDNREVAFTKAPINEGTLDIEGMPRIATADHTLSYKGKPFYIIPSWSLKPFSPVENYSEVEKEKMNTAGRRLILSKLETERIAPKKAGWGIGGWAILGIVILIAGWYLLKGGKLF